MHFRHKTSLMTQSSGYFYVSDEYYSIVILDLYYYFGQSCGLKYLSYHKYRINLDGKDFNNLTIVLVLGEIFLIENTYLLIFWLYLTTYLYNYYPLISKAAKGVKQAFQSC